MQSSKVPEWHSAECHPGILEFSTSDAKFLSRTFYLFWPPFCRKFRFGTFDPKTRKSWRETLHTTGAKFLNAGVAPCTLQNATPALRNLAPVVRKIHLQDFLPVFVALGPKIPVRYFRPGCDQEQLQKECDQFLGGGR